MRILKLRIEVDVSVHLGYPNVAQAVNLAMQELVNRRDFKELSIPQGRALQHYNSMDDVTVTVDILKTDYSTGDHK